MLSTISTKFAKYLLALIDIIEKDKINSNKYKSIKKIRSKIVEILAKYQNLLKFKSKKLFFKFKNLVKVSNANVIKEYNCLTSNIKIFFTKLREIFT